MSVKTVLIAAALVVGATSMAMAQNSPGGNTGPAGGGAGTASGKSGSGQNNNRGPGKNATVHPTMKHHTRHHHHHHHKKMS